MLLSDNVFEFSDETDEDDSCIEKTTIWNILSVEDSTDYQAALVSSLNAITLPPHTCLKIHTAQSAYQASKILNSCHNIGLILLDVVMEEDDAGLRLVSIIREEIGDASVRIVLLTGQPGFAPEQEVMQSLDIDEYWNKSDINEDKLKTIVYSNMRTWAYMRELTEARQGLQIVLDAARSINSRYDLPSFTRTVLSEIGNILGVESGGLFCMGDSVSSIDEARVETATGCYSDLEGLFISDQNLSELKDDLTKALREQKHVITGKQSIFYFDTNNINDKCYLIVVNSDAPISEAHRNLLQVFSENIHSGFTNIALLNRVTELAYTHIDLNIPNRNWLKKQIGNMTSKERENTRLLMLEINHFDEMKFTFGYEFVQNVLSFMFRKIQDILPPSSQVSLSGHKQFSILLNVNFSISSELIDGLTYNEIEVDGVAHSASFTLLDMRLDGIKPCSAARIISMAESALKQASVHGDAYVQHSQADADEISHRYSLMGELRAAIRQRALSVMLQPKISLSSGRVVGFEALARWQREDGSFVRPDIFIAIAEASGLIHKLDCLIFEKCVEVLHQLCDLGYKLPVSFNASAYDLVHPEYFSNISATISRSMIKPELLELEVTETQAISDYDKIKKSLQCFIELGIKISIDDFGTGYSSLAHIAKITAHCIKIDRTFVRDLETDENSQHVIKMILKLGKQFGFNIVAEGIETDYQRQWLKAAGCNVGQGFLFSKPMFIDDVITFLSQENIG